MAALLGGIIGIEREYRNKSAGFRTMILISVGACFFTMISIYIGKPDTVDRIASNIVTGIGFLGAGVIFRGENRVSGITTAATIWAVAAIGMGIGAGYYWTSAIAGTLIIFILSILPYLESFIDQLNQSKNYAIQVAYTTTAGIIYEKLMQQYNLKYKIVKQVKRGDTLTITWMVHGHNKNHDKFANALREDVSIEHFEF